MNEAVAKLLEIRRLRELAEQLPVAAELIGLKIKARPVRGQLGQAKIVRRSTGNPVQLNNRPAYRPSAELARKRAAKAARKRVRR